jgi:N-acetylmuramic acid 6-phosphate etherase
VTCKPDVPASAAREVVPLAVGPEVLTGSTRLKAGTATKHPLNTLTTATFARLGKVFGNRMVDLRPRSAKLRARALGLVRQLGRVPPREAERLLKASGASAKVAIAMARLGVDAPEARRRLKRASGSLRRALD